MHLSNFYGVLCISGTIINYGDQRCLHVHISYGNNGSNFSLKKMFTVVEYCFAHCGEILEHHRCPFVSHGFGDLAYKACSRGITDCLEVSYRNTVPMTSSRGLIPAAYSLRSMAHIKLVCL